MKHRNPAPTVDLIITDDSSRVLLIERLNEPHGWALPGGFVDYGESCEHAAIREGKEETSLDLELIRQFHTYSDPGRDARLHTISVVFVAKVVGGVLCASDDAKDAAWFPKDELPHQIAFDHRQIIDDFFTGKY